MRRNWCRKIGKLLQRGLQLRAALGRRLRGEAGAVEEAGDVGALAGQRAQDRLGVACQLRQLVALGSEDREQAVGVAQRRVGAADNLGEVFAARGEAGAQLVEDEAEALRVGSRMMSLTRSTSTPLPLFSSGSRYWPAPGWPSGTLASGGGTGEPGARGRVGRQSM